MALRQIKNKIRSVQKTHQVTKAMEAVSAVKMRKSQERALLGRPYAQSALSILKRVSGSLDVRSHPYVKAGAGNGKVGIILVTSDKGLAGALNAGLIKHVERHIAQKGFARDSIIFYTLGKKGYEYFSRRGYTIGENYVLSENPTEEEVKEVLSLVTKHFLAGNIDSCVLAYNNFLSTFEQEPVASPLIPLDGEVLAEVIESIAPTKGKFAEEETEKKVFSYTVEPSADEVFEELIARLLLVELYHAVLEAQASEHSARMVAMKNASDKARDVTKELKLRFNKERQAAITSEVSEIISGIETVK